METFYSKLKVANPNAVVLSIIPEYSKSFIPVLCTDKCLVNLSTLYKPEYLDLSYNLLTKCEQVFGSLIVTKEQATNLEKKPESKPTLNCGFITELVGLLHQSLNQLPVLTQLNHPNQLSRLSATQS